MSNQTTLTTEETAKVFAMYLGCDFEYRYIDYEKGVWAKGAKLNIDRLQRVLSDKSIDGIRLLLTPLSSITIEDCFQVSKIPYLPAHVNSGLEEQNYFAYLREHIKSICISDSHIFQLLINMGYPVPLYFGADHPCNGMDAIQLGIGIDKTKH